MNRIQHKQGGFTLVEIAIVLVIIGLLLGGILKGQELINSARVRNLADMNAGIQAAYFGFIDRYRQVPGDVNTTNASQAIGTTINGGGDDNGRLDGGWSEAGAVWEHLSKAGFISGTYQSAGAGVAVDATNYRDNAPSNAFNGAPILYRTSDYFDPNYALDGTGTAPAERLSLTLGNNIPVNIARELDVKQDDGLPATGVVRMTLNAAGLVDFDVLDTGSDNCVEVIAGDSDIWDIATNSQDCNAVFLY
ncbi:MAG: prepilin-type N-terminal cleavage/methylation domain-containing protein [Gammaproteobacteria bacterium]|nr:prepilin-type N-terminal cleavage/methylation domain-containing protein [Gammaproteobacteria bacterium]